MRVATWNVNSLRVRLEQVLDWLKRERVDVLALQETKLQDDKFPREEFAELGYEVVFSGQPTYNGVATLATAEMSGIATEIAGFDDPSRRVLITTIGDVRIFNLYVPNGQRVGSEKYDYKLGWLAALKAQLESELQSHPDTLLVGDFNIAPEDRDVHDPELWRGRILCSEPERDALRGLLDLGLVDVFRRFEDRDDLFSWWDYRAGAFRRNRGLRIDLILASGPLAARSTGCEIDTGPRGLERPSDHTPVIAEFSS